VRLIEFSPDEKCMVTYSSREPSNPNEKAGLLLNVYDCNTGHKLRQFEGSIEDYAVGSAAAGDGSLKWPIFKWASNTCAPWPFPPALTCLRFIGLTVNPPRMRRNSLALNLR